MDRFVFSASVLVSGWCPYYFSMVFQDFDCGFAGEKSFNGKSLHELSTNIPNPYEQAISIIGRTLSSFDEDNLIPCFGFGDGMWFLSLDDRFNH